MNNDISAFYEAIFGPLPTRVPGKDPELAARLREMADELMEMAEEYDDHYEGGGDSRTPFLDMVKKSSSSHVHQWGKSDER